MKTKIAIASIVSLAVVAFAGALAAWQFHYKPQAELSDATAAHASMLGQYEAVVSESADLAQSAQENGVSDVHACPQHTAKDQLGTVKKIKQETIALAEKKAKCEKAVEDARKLIEHTQNEARKALKTEKEKAQTVINNAKTALNTIAAESKAGVEQAIVRAEKAIREAKNTQTIAGAVKELEYVVQTAKTATPTNIPAETERPVAQTVPEAPAVENMEEASEQVRVTPTPAPVPQAEPSVPQGGGWDETYTYDDKKCMAGVLGSDPVEVPCE